MNYPQITKHQEAVLTRMAMGSKYMTMTSIESDGKTRKEVDLIFAEDMQLVEWGLVFNISTNPKEAKIIEEMKAEDGRDYFVLKATPATIMMFNRRRGKRWIN